MQFIPTISPVPSVAPKAAATPSEPKAKSSSDFANLLASQPVRDAKAPTTGDTSTPVDSTTATGETDKGKQDEGKTLLDDLLAALGKLDAALQGDQPVDPTLVDNVNAALAKLSAGAAKFSIQASFTQKLADTLSAGLGNLVDANMADESASLQSLQVKQQLGVQALSIANQAPQTILSLFGR